MAIRKSIQNAYKYQAMFGVGGIGSGLFFELNHNQPIGREESRSGHLLNRQDYCKLHIVSHYMQVLLGTGFRCVPIGRVGQDEPGKRLIKEMAEAGLSTRYVILDPNNSTLFSICVSYPDGAICNMTTDDSACRHVSMQDIRAAELEMDPFDGRAIALALPEIPLAVRAAYLEMAGQKHLFRAASFTCEEMDAVVADGIIQNVDLLAVNREEAAALCKSISGRTMKEDDPVSLIQTIAGLNPEMAISITAGRDGATYWDGTDLLSSPARGQVVVSTAGAGDAHLAGLLTGIAAGFNSQEALDLAAWTAAFSIQSPDTIAKDLTRKSLVEFIHVACPTCLPGQLIEFLRDDPQ